MERVVLVTGLPESRENEGLEEQLSAHLTSTTGCRVDSVTRRQDGTAEVTFASREGVRTVLLHPKQLFLGQELEIVALAPEEEDQPAEASKDDDTLEDATVVVSNWAPVTTKDALMLYFENRRSGGGEVINFEYSKSGSEALITFADYRVAERVLEKEEHRIDDVVLTVRKPDPRFLDQAKILVKNISSGTTKDYLLLFMEKMADIVVTDVDLYKDDGVAIVSFEEDVDIQNLIQRASGKTVHGRQLEFQLVWRPTAIVVSGISPDTTTETLQMFFENERRSGGDDVVKVERTQTGDKATIHFKDPGVVDRVIHYSLSRDLLLDGAKLKVQARTTAFSLCTVDEEPPRPITPPQPPQSSFTKKPVINIIDGERYKYIKDHLFQQELVASVETAEGVLDLSEPGKVIVHPRQEMTTRQWEVWESTCRAKLEAALSKIDVERKEVPADLWEALAEKIQECRQRHQTVMLMEDREAGELVIVGHNRQEVRQAYQLLSVFIEECVKKSAEVVTEEDFHPGKLKLLQKTGFLDETTAMETKIDTSTGRVTLIGNNADAATKLIKEMYKKMSDFERRALNVDDLRGQMITSDHGVEYIQGLFAALNISAEYYSDNDDLVCLATTKKDADAALTVIESAIVTDTFVVPKESVGLCESPKWRNLTEEISEPLLQCKECVTVETTVVRLTGTKEKVAEAQRRLTEFLRQNTIVNTTLAVDIGTSRYLWEHQNIKKVVEDKLKQKRERIEINPAIGDQGNPVGGFLIRGTREGIDEACSLIREYAAKVKTGRYRVQKPGMQHFLTEGAGRDSIKLIETTQKCVIELENVKTETPAGAIGGQEENTQQICSYTREDGRDFVVLFGDLTCHSVDVMVNAANPELKLGGGLAKRIVSKGGKRIQEDCTKLLEEEGLKMLRPGTAVKANSHALPCKLLVHAISPRWPEGSRAETYMFEDPEDRQEVKDLKHAVYRSLILADNYKSIALPVISTGAYGFPLELAVRTIVGTVEEFFKNYPTSSLRSVHFMDSQKPAVNALCKEFVRRYGESAIMLDQHETGILPPNGATPGATPGATSGAPSGATSGATPQPDAENELTTPSGLRLCLVEGDITDQKAHVLVNSIGNDLELKVGGVSKAFYLKGGDQLQKSCSSHGKVSDGQVIKTPSSGKLSCKEVYHVCCQAYGKDSKSKLKAEKILAELIDNCLKKANSSGMASIAFPALGTGNLKFPGDTVARITFERVMNFGSRGTKGSLQRVDFVVFDKPTVDAFKSELISLKRKNVPQAASATLRKERKGFSELDLGNVKLEVYQGDLLSAKVDAVVSVTDIYLMRQKHGIAAAILKKAGDSVIEECKQKGRQANGAVVMTGGGRLCSKIFHMVSPNDTNLTSGVRTVLNLAEQNKINTIAFPAVGTGNIGIDPDLAAGCIIDAVQEFAQTVPKNVKTVKIIVYERKHLPHFEKELTARATVETTKPSEGLLKRIRRTVKNPFTEAPEDKKSNVELYICYFADDNATINKAHRQLESTMNEHLIGQEIEHDYVPHLTDEECDVIQAKCRLLDVYVEIERDPVLKTIKLRGASHSFADASSFIHAFLNGRAEMVTEDKAAELLQKTVQWNMTDSSESRELLDPRSNKIVEDAFQNQLKEVDFQVQRRGQLCRFRLDFSKYYATNLGTRERLKVNRRSFEVPKHWSPQPKDSSGQPVKVHEVELDSTSEEYNDVFESFVGSMGDRSDKVKIHRIVRVQNPELYQQYNVKKLQMEMKHPDREVERRLFHATSADTCADINLSGWNRSYCGKNATLYGQGSYFAADAFYSSHNRYSPTDVHGQRRMYMACVLVGEYCKGRGDLKDAPKKSDNPGESDTYDSVVDNETNPRIFVIFKDAQAYPEYLITFSYS
ncbi:protein mono-ADP-ribosyltransferase PARP14-like [Branchiostoma floridae x Branchiostoma japonicum]